jgi:hemoglobin
MRRAISVFGLTLISAPFAFAQELPVDPYVVSNSNAGAMPSRDPALLAAFHGQAGIGRIVDDLVGRAVVDRQLADIFHATDLERLRRTLKEQIGYLLGTGVDYSGRDMKAAHKDQGINTTEFNVLVELLQGAMEREGVNFSAQNKLLYKLAPMKRDVVTR